MSCDTLKTNSGASGFNVTVASLPEGFCPSSMQDLANAIAARLIVSSNQAFSSFAIGSVQPATNVGPWLKNCLEWFVFNDATATYLPIRRGFDSIQYFNTAGSSTFIVPDSTYKLKIHAFGGGGGGSNSDAASPAGSGGGGGAYGLSIVTVVPGQSISMTIGAGGAVGINGGDTTILGKTAAGGKASTSYLTSGLGGTATGFDVNLNGGAGMANSGGNAADGGSSGGDAGGWGGKGGAVMSNSVPVVPGRAGTSPGGGGSGGGNAASSIGGAGASGAILLEY